MNNSQTKNNLNIVNSDNKNQKKEIVMSAFRRRTGDIFRAILIPLFALLILTIIRGVARYFETNSNVVKAINVLNILIAFIPFLVAISIATTFSSNRTLGAIATILGLIVYLFIQIAFIRNDGTKILAFGSNKLSISTLVSPFTKVLISNSTYYFIMPNFVVAFIIGYVNALIISALNKKNSKLQKIGFIEVVISILLISIVSSVFSLLHTSLVFFIVNLLENNKNSYLGMTRAKVSHLIVSFLITGLSPFDISNSLKEIVGVNAIARPAFSFIPLIWSVFILPMLGISFISNAEKKNLVLSLSLFLPAILSSILLGEYSVLLISLLFISPFLFGLIAVVFTSLTSWMLILLDKFNDFFGDSIINFVHFWTRNTNAWILLLICLAIAILSFLLAFLYIRFTKVCVLGRGHNNKKMFNDEYIVENEYVLFTKVKDNKLVFQQSSDNLLSNMGIIKADEISIIEKKNKKKNETKEVTIEEIVLSNPKPVSKKQSETTITEDIARKKIYKIVSQDELMLGDNEFDLEFEKQKITNFTNTDFDLPGDDKDLTMDLTPTKIEEKKPIIDYEKTTEISPKVINELNMSEGAILSSKPINNESPTIHQPKSQPQLTGFAKNIKSFMILCPLKGVVKGVTNNSIDILSTSGKFIMPNDAIVEYITEDKNIFLLNIYGTRVQVNLNANFSKDHKQRLHNKIYVAIGKQLYKGDFFLEGNKKFYSEIGEEMIINIKILPGNYKVIPIHYEPNQIIDKWDGLFEINK
ncbi:hypothetical protein [Metamycoplasma buccale]|uniref:hypothetical protein n=1 Tax=Metamycoplasma buccale TaxID=55602 RepID=UPI00398F7EF7